MNDLTINQNREVVTQNDIDVLRKSKFKDFTDSEINYAASVCSHLQLNPLLNQIHFVKRNVRNKDGTYSPVITVQVGIDGFRLAADRTGKYAGSDDPFFEYAKNDEKQVIPKKATITVYKLMGSARMPFTASARWDEYLPTDEKSQRMWIKMPHTMLAKVCEALALRKAFPAELSALRSEEEMHQADEIETKAEKLNKRAVEVESEVVDTGLVTTSEIVEMFKLAKDNNVSNEIVKSMIEELGFASSSEITTDAYLKIIGMIKAFGMQKPVENKKVKAKPGFNINNDKISTQDIPWEENK